MIRLPFNLARGLAATACAVALTLGVAAFPCVAADASVVVRRPLVVASSPAAKGGQTLKVKDAILGVRVGSHLDEVHDKLKSLGTVGGRATRNGGRKEAWTLKKTEFTSIAYQTNKQGRVVWVTAFLRPGKEMAFTKFGDLAQAASKSEQAAVWNVERAEGNFRLITKGAQGKASVVHLLSLVVPPK